MSKRKVSDKLYFDTIKQFRAVAYAAILAVLAGMTFYHYVEGWSWVDSFYFCVVTLATVGYGDITPTTNVGKIFTAFYILAGIGIIAAFANLFLKQAVVRKIRKQQEEK